MKKIVISEFDLQEMVERQHYPVMYREVLNLLDLRQRRIVVDCTIGVGSHAYKIMEVMGRDSFLIGIDRDQDSLSVANQRLKSFAGRFVLIKGDFSDLAKILGKLNINRVDAFLFDLGISTYQLSNPQRGFSFLNEGPLDMRMDKDSFLSAYDLINNLSEGELENIFKKFGEERYSRRIAHFLVEVRKKEPIATTTQLARMIKEIIPQSSRYYKIHPATRVFQSLRIAVNRELEALKAGLSEAISFLNKGGRIAVISFHSLEDRIVKHLFRNYYTEGALNIITKKPLEPSDLEKAENPSSRSAKLRVAEKK
jgi:16S rRNA (cytosine1402-N4)-methyltransferase